MNAGSYAFVKDTVLLIKKKFAQGLYPHAMLTVGKLCLLTKNDVLIGHCYDLGNAINEKN